MMTGPSPRWTRVTSLTLGASLFVLAGCASSDQLDTPEPVATAPAGGWIVVSLTTPRPDDGAVQFHIAGPGIDSAVVDGYEGFAVVASSAADVIVTGRVVSGAVARVHVTASSPLADYRGTVLAAAARSSYAPQEIANYRLTLSR